MKKILYSPAKINIALDVGYLRQDNYHEIKSVVFPVSLCDKIEFDYEQRGFTLQTDSPEISTTTNNFIIQIIHEMESIWDFKANVGIFIHKKIPILSGLGGGSSNAATIMKELVCHFHLKASDEQLIDIGKKYSCDIPFFIYGKPALVQGAGEVVSFINSDCDLMIFKGNINCYICLLKSPLTLENTKFIAGELSLKVSLVLYLPTGHYEP